MTYDRNIHKVIEELYMYQSNEDYSVNIETDLH